MFIHTPTVSFVPLITTMIKLATQAIILLTTLKGMGLYKSPLTTQYKYNNKIKKVN